MAYEQDGFVFPLRAMSPPQAAEIRARIEAMEKSSSTNDGASVTIRGYGNIAVDFIDEISRLDTVLDPVSEILGSDLLVWGANLFIKEPHTAEYVSWHQDLTYWGLDDTEEVTAWVAITPATVANGCMRFIAGSHRNDIVAHRDTFARTNLLSRGQELAVDVNEADAVDVELSAGEFSLHHGRMFHASNPNRSNDRRIGLAIRYISTRMAQVGNTRTIARLVRGEDRYNNFELAPAPSGTLAPADVQTMIRAEQLQAQYAYEGSAQDGKRRV